MNKRSCRVCRQETVSVFFEIEDLPVHCNLLWPDREQARTAPMGDIRLGFCEACGMIYNCSFDPDAMRYTSGYETSLHFSPHFQAYAQQLAERLIKEYGLRGKDIIEIGCGQGEFLSLLCEGGRNRGVGFDPSFDPGREHTTGEHLTFVPDRYAEIYSECKADLICCRHVLEHVPAPRDFLLQIRRAIGKRAETVVFFEVPNVLYTLRDLGIWDVIYEHCSYFSPSSLSRLFAETGFNILRLYDAYAGQFLCVEAVPGRVGDHAEASRQKDVSEIGRLVPAFADNHRKKVEAWKQEIGDIIRSGRRAVVWGAGSKGVTFLNTLKVCDHIEHVVDMNRRKQGLYVPGTGQRIVPPDELRRFKPDLIIVMNAVYRSEIQQMTSRLHVPAQLLTA